MIRRRGALLLAAALAGCAVVGITPPLNDAQQVIADMAIGPSPLKILATRGDTTYRRGAPIRLSFEVTRPAHVAILRVNHSGATTLVFPNRAQMQSLVPANTRIAVPAQSSGVTVTAGPPGHVLFEFIAATDGSSFLFNTPPKGSADFAEFGATTRDVAKMITISLRGAKGGATAAAHAIVTVE